MCMYIFVLLLLCECEIVSSSDLQCTVNLEGGKLVCNTGKFCHVQEIKGGEMIEVNYILSVISVS